MKWARKNIISLSNEPPIFCLRRRFLSCVIFLYPKGKKFQACGQRVDWYGMVTDALLYLDFKHSE